MCVRRRCGGHQDASYGNEGDRNQRVPATPADSRAWARARRRIRSSTAACAHRRFTPQKITFKRTHRTMQLINFTSPNNRLTGRPARVASTALQVRGANTCSTRLGRVHFKVRDVNRSIPFYTNILGLRLTEHTGRYAFLGTDTEHHSVALEEFDALTIAPSRCAVGMARVGFEVPDRVAFVATHDRLLRVGMPITIGDNGISWVMRFEDPDGNEIEIYLDRRKAPDGTALWDGRWQAFKIPKPFCATAPAPMRDSLAAKVARPAIHSRGDEGKRRTGSNESSRI